MPLLQPRCSMAQEGEFLNKDGPVTEGTHARKVRRVRLKWERDPKSKEGKWTIIKERVLPRMALLASHEIGPDVPLESIAGLWFDVTDDDETVIFRGRIPDPRLAEVEIFDEEGAPSRAVAEQEEMILDVLLPDTPFISKIRLFNTKARKKKRSVDDLRPITKLRMKPTAELMRESE